ncbi:MAG: hypothetical protein K1Y36_28605 [Blastocatellia bacterium]|nr:hypothetical protein [Blastocatellia bacterium]
MPDLMFEILGAEPDRYAAAPALQFKLHITNRDDSEAIHSILLRTQIQIEPTRRLYQDEERAALVDLFGEPARWNQTLRTMVWTHVSHNVGPFMDHTTIDLTVPCTFDFNVAATKFFAGLEQGEAPLLFQMSGTIFYASADNTLQVAQIPWTTETRFRLPVRAWSEMMEVYYPNCVWLNLRRDAFDELYQYKTQHGIPTFEAAIEHLLNRKGKGPDHET